MVARRLGVALLAALLPASVGAQLTGTQLVDAIDAAARAHVESAIIPGVSVAVVKDGETILQRGYGVVDMEWGVKTPPDGGASYEIGSVTKQFTAAAVLLLAEEGRVDLDADFTRYVEFDAQGRTVPVRRLLDHTSGIKGYTEMPVFGELTPFSLPKDTLVRLVEAEPFEFEPGTAQIYNNSAYFLLGLIIEEVSGESYEDFVTTRLFEPLGMDDSYYCSHALLRGRRAHGYDAVRPDMVIRARYLDHTWPYAAGSLCSTVGDLVKWNRALHGGGLLSPESYRQMTTPAPLEGGEPIRYAMGLGVDERNGTPVIAHGGGINGFLSDGRYYPAEDLLVVVLQNSTGPTGPGALAQQIVELALGPPEPPSAVPFDGEATSFAGTYSGAARGQTLSVEVRADGGGLVFTADGQTLRPAYQGDLTWREGGTILRFTRDGSGALELRFDVGSGHYVLRR